MPLTRRQILSLIWTPIGLLNVPDTAKSQQLLQSPKRVRIINPYRNEILDGLIAWWKFDEGTGTSAYDSSGNGRHMTLSNPPNWTSGLSSSGSALDFEASSSDYLGGVGDVTWFDGLSAISICVRLKPETLSVDQHIISKWGPNGDWHSFLLGLHNVTPGRIVVAVYSGSAYLIHDSTDAVLSNGTEAHVCATWTAGNLDIYIDGSEVASTNRGSNSPTSIANKAAEFQIGARDNAGSPDRYFDGIMDDVRIYNRVLSAAEVAAIANGEG